MNSKYTLIFIFFFFSFSQGIGQIRGYIFSTEEKQPVPYVNISVAGKQIGFTANKNGAFEIPAAFGADTLTYSSIGYKTLRNLGSQIGDTVWMQVEFELLEEVVVWPQKQQIYAPLKIKDYKSELSYLSNAIPWRLGNFYRKQDFNDTFPNISSINILVQNPKRKAEFQLSIIKANEFGEPLNEPLIKPIIVQVKKGEKITSIRLNNLIAVPENGFFIVVEALLIPSNKYVKRIQYENGKKERKTFYAPTFLTQKSTQTCCDMWLFSHGEWQSKQSKSPYNHHLKMSVFYSN